MFFGKGKVVDVWGVACKVCKHFVDVEHAQAVEVSNKDASWVEYFCPEHKVPYERVMLRHRGWGEPDAQYYVAQKPWREVKEDGSEFECVATHDKKAKK